MLNLMFDETLGKCYGFLTSNCYLKCLVNLSAAVLPADSSASVVYPNGRQKAGTPAAKDFSFKNSIKTNKEEGTSRYSRHTSKC